LAQVGAAEAEAWGAEWAWAVAGGSGISGAAALGDIHIPPAGPYDPAGAEESLLARQAEYFEEELARIKERLEELKKSQDEKAEEK
jgi:hypothetical protein